jgi:ligand-binding sensor domain-containing protein
VSFLKYAGVLSVCLLTQMFSMNCDSKKVLGPEETLEWTIYTTADGLNYDLIYDIAIDNQDRIWIATWWGINVFDGQKWDTIDASDGLPYENARVLHFDYQGNLWIGSGGNGNGLVKYDGTTFTLYTTTDGLSDNRIESIGSQPNGTIWVGTVFGGTCRFDGSQWTCFDTSYVNHRHILSIYGESDSSIWFGTSDGVTHYDGNNWNKYLRVSDSVEPVQWYKQIRAITFDTNGFGWFGFFAGVYRYFNYEFEFIDDYVLDNISDIVESAKGGMWFSSYSDGVYRYWKNGWTNYSIADGLPDYYVTSIAEDSKGIVWFGTGKGLVKLHVL